MRLWLTLTLGLLVTYSNQQDIPWFRSRDRISKIDLLKQIIVQNSGKGNRLKEQERSIFNRVSSSKANSLPQNFRPTPQGRTNSLSIGNRNRVNNDCEALKVENKLLKQLLSNAHLKGKQTDQFIRGANNLDLNTLQPLLHHQGQSSSTRPLPLSAIALLTKALKNSAKPTSPKNREERGAVELSTIIETKSYETYIIAEETKDISLKFNGKWKTTPVIQTITKTSTITEILSTVITITPTPTVKRQEETIININPKFHHRRENNNIEDNRFSNNFDSHENRFTSPLIRPFRRKSNENVYKPTTTAAPRRHVASDSLKALQAYLQRIKEHRDTKSMTVPTDLEKLKAQKHQEENSNVLSRSDDSTNNEDSTVVTTDVQMNVKGVTSAPDPGSEDINNEPETLVSSKADQNSITAENSVSIITIFLSGSVPGVYSTSLSTVTLSDSTGTRSKREALQIISNSVQTPEDNIRPTRSLKKETSAHIELEQTEKDYCNVKTVTITVLNTQTCIPDQ